MNFLIAFAIIWALLLSPGRSSNPRRGRLRRPGSPAAGQLQPGDRILSIDGMPGYAPALNDKQITRRQIALRARGRQAPLRRHADAGLRRDDAGDGRRPARRRARHPAHPPRYDAGGAGDAARHRLRPANDDIGPVRGAGLAVSQMWRVTKATVAGIVKIFYNPQARKQVSGVVGSFEVTRQTIDFDTTRALYILALISLSLAVVNLFPFLPLDGGHIFWALAEKIRGRPIPFAVMERASVVGFMLVAILFVIGLTNDIGRLTGDGFNVR